MPMHHERSKFFDKRAWNSIDWQMQGYCYVCGSWSGGFLKTQPKQTEADYAIAAWLKYIYKTAVGQGRLCESTLSGSIHQRNCDGAWERPLAAIPIKPSGSHCPICTRWNQDGHKHMTKQCSSLSKTPDRIRPGPPFKDNIQWHWRNLSTFAKTIQV